MKTFFKLLTISFLINLGTLTAAIAQHHSATDKPENAGMLEIVATDYAFDAPEKIPSGWTTIEFINDGEDPHMLLFHLLPVGKTLDHFAGELYPPVNEWWMAVRDDGMDPSEARQVANLPAWFGDAQWMGGAGFIDPGLSTKITMKLPPGTYVMECYIKTEDGELHAMEGMLRELTVTDERSEATPPEANIDITLSNYEMDIYGDLTPGSHTVAVHFAEGSYHNEHVARLDSDGSVQDVLAWLPWLEHDGLWPPAPATLLGGMNILPEGETGYFTLDLEPGRYLFVSEMTGRAGVLKEVTIDP